MKKFMLTLANTYKDGGIDMKDAEQILKALDVFKGQTILYYGLGRESVTFQDVIDFITEQQAEIERIKEVNVGLALANLCDLPPNEDCLTDNEFEIARKTISELQEQVDELKGKICELVADKCHLVVKEKQVVKDTAKEIYQEIDKSDILVVETQEYGEIEVVPMDRLKEIIKSKGVEVE